MTMHKLLSTLVALALISIGGAAAAQEKKGCAPGDPLCAGASKQRGVITLAEVTITGRIQKPIAAVDVSRIAPKLTLAELRQPFLDRIEQAVFKDPF
jgi:hypothetical protein